MWQKKIDAAGQQIAAILSLVDGRNMTLEARLQTMEHWRSSAEQAWAGQSKVRYTVELVCRADAASDNISSMGSPAPHKPMAIQCHGDDTGWVKRPLINVKGCL